MSDLLGRGRVAARRRGKKCGMTLVEVTIAMSIVSTVLMASAGAFLTSIAAVHGAQRTSRANVHLRTVMENLAAQPYTNLLSFNGNRFYDKDDESSSTCRVDLTVFQAAVDLRQIQAVLVDLRSGKEIGRLATLRANR